MSRPTDRVLIALIGEGARSYARRAVLAMPDRVHTTSLTDKHAQRLELIRQCQPYRRLTEQEVAKQRRASLEALLSPMSAGSHARGCVDLITCATSEELEILRAHLDVHVIAVPPYVSMLLDNRYLPLWVELKDPECLWPIRHALELLDAGRTRDLSLRGDL